LLDRNQLVRAAANKALGQIYERAFDGESRNSDDPHSSRRAELLGLLELTYEDRSTVPHARWLAHYVGGGLPAIEAHILCAYLGRPASDPVLPDTSEKARPILKALKTTLPGAGEQVKPESDLRFTREDAAAWIAWIVTGQVTNWTAGDVDFLRGLQDAIARE